MIGADAVVRALNKLGVSHVFGIVSIHNMPIFDAINRDGSIRIIDCRHEMAATHAADGYARATGKPGVVLVTSGPGATNAVTGVATAYLDSIPLVVITVLMIMGRSPGFAAFWATIACIAISWVKKETRMGPKEIWEAIQTGARNTLIIGATVGVFIGGKLSAGRLMPSLITMLALQGLVLFSVNYWLIYLAEVHVTSGLVAVIFSGIVFMNMINGAVLLGSPIRSNVLLGGAIGVLGIVLVFWPQLISFSLSNKGALGLVLSVVSTFMASLGNIISARHQQNNLPVIQTNAYGMLYGSFFTTVFAYSRGANFTFNPSFNYVASLIYLALFGSVIAFGSYLTLLGRIGADRAAYITIIFPFIALLLSALFENFNLQGFQFFGVGLILIGNAIVLTRRNRKR